MNTTHEHARPRLDTQLLRQLEKLIGQLDFHLLPASEPFVLTQEELELDLHYGAVD